MFKRYRAAGQKPRIFGTKGQHSTMLAALNVSQEVVPGYRLHSWQETPVFIVGCGALGSWTLEGCAMNGARHLGNCDSDQVELKNLTRQAFCTRDLGTYKVFASAKRLVKKRLFPLEIEAYPSTLSEALDDIDIARYAAIAVLPDNDAARKEAAEVGIKFGIPVVGAGLAEDARSLYIAVQQPEKACLACIRPTIADETGGQSRCGVPGSVDSVWVAVGFVLYALEQVVCRNELKWNYRTSYLTGARPDSCSIVDRNPDCPLCKSAERHDD